MKLRRLAAIVAIVAALGLAVSACGSSGGGGSSSAAGGGGSSSAAGGGGSSSNASAPSGAPIKIGTICTCSGVYAADSAKGIPLMKAWVDSMNGSGGLNGHRVQLFAEDVGSSPQKALAAAKKLVEQDHVVAIVGSVTNVTGAYQKYVEQKKVPIVGGFSYESGFETSPMFFTAGTTATPGTLSQYVQYAHAGIKKVGFMYCAEAPVCAEAVPLGKKAAAIAGIGFTSVSITSNQPNYTAACSSFKQAKVDGLYIGEGPDTLLRIAADCANVGFKPTMLGETVTFDSTLAKSPYFDKSIWNSPNANPFDESVPGFKQMRDALKKYNPGLLNDAGLNTNTADSAWVGGLLFEAASKAGGGFTDKTTPADVIAGLKKLKSETLEGTAPPLTYNNDKPPLATTKCYFAMHVANGKLVSDNGGKASCLSDEQLAKMTG
jgi:branched-chain amino acid transport system substrate-binding protein